MTTTTEYLMDETPVDYGFDNGDPARVRMTVEDGDDCAGMGVANSEAAVNLRLDRDELVALIAAAAKALSLLS